jgi:hypothetical protein
MKKGAGGSLAIVVPPDGGWGWVVVFAAFYCNVVVDGIIYSFGMLLKDMVDSFHESESKISIVGSLLNGFYLIAGIKYILHSCTAGLIKFYITKHNALL